MLKIPCYLWELLIELGLMKVTTMLTEATTCSPATSSHTSWKSFRLVWVKIFVRVNISSPWKSVRVKIFVQEVQPSFMQSIKATSVLNTLEPCYDLWSWPIHFFHSPPMFVSVNSSSSKLTSNKTFKCFFSLKFSSSQLSLYVHHIHLLSNPPTSQFVEMNLTETVTLVCWEEQLPATRG